MIRLGIVNHNGRTSAGAELALLLFLDQLPSDIKPFFFLFEEGQFTDLLRLRYGSVTVVPMSQRIATTTRTTLNVSAFWGSFILLKQLADAFRRARIDIVLTNSAKAHVIGSVAAKTMGIPCVNFLHDFVYGLPRRIIREISRFCADERLACSRAVDRNIGLPRTTVLHSPIELTEYEHLPSRTAARGALGFPDDALPIVGIVGRISRAKGQDRFIRIAARVLRDTDAHFAIIGGAVFGCDPEFPQELQDFIAREGLERRIRFIPWQDNLHNVYAAIDIACNCSTKEPFGRTTIEALACKVPVICFDDAGVCEIFEQHHGGIQVPAGNEILFADALRTYLRDPILMSKAREDALDAVKPLEVSRVSQRFNDVLRRISASKGPVALP